MLWATILANLALGLPISSEGSPLNKGRHSKNPIVDLGYAQYEGTALDVGVNQFLGIRYASPPLGNLRFRAPEDPVVTHGVQDAKEVWNLPYYRGFIDFEFSLFSSSEQPASGHLGPDQH
jgi:hypothetical protein